MQNVFIGGNLHEMSNLFFGTYMHQKKYFWSNFAQSAKSSVLFFFLFFFNF